MSLLVCALAELSSRFEDKVVDTTPGATTLDVVVVAPSRNPSNKLDISRSSGSNQLGKNASIVARLPYLWQGKRNYPECNDSGCSQNCSSYERVQQVRYEPIERIEPVGNEREHRRKTTVFMAENKTTPSATTLDVVEIAPHASSSNKLGINQSNRSNLLGKMRSSLQATIKGHGGSRFI
jgi:hypothetical protein